MGWTDERVAELKRLVDSGLSGPDIASAMGVTRSVINGKCHRLGISIKRKECEPAPKPLKPSKAARLFVGSWGACPEIIPGHIPPTPVADLVPMNIPLADIGAFQCRWITSQQPALFCGHRTEVGSWCPTHRAIVFTPRTEKRGARVLEAA